MTNLIKTLLKKRRREPKPEDIEALQRANQVLQFRVARLLQTEKPAGRAA